jgi:hypothetical protein
LASTAVDVLFRRAELGEAFQRNLISSLLGSLIGELIGAGFGALWRGGQALWRGARAAWNAFEEGGWRGVGEMAFDAFGRGLGGLRAALRGAPDALGNAANAFRRSLQNDFDILGQQARQMWQGAGDFASRFRTRWNFAFGSPEFTWTDRFNILRHGAGGFGGGSDPLSEYLYRAMSEKEFARVIETGGLIRRESGSHHLGVTPDREYVESLISRKRGARDYAVIAEFEVEAGTTSRLIDLGATHESVASNFPSHPRFTSGMNAVQLKLEKGGVFSLGLGSSQEGLDIFNNAIISIRRLNP